MADKMKIGLYWAASCGGCDISVLDIGEHVLELIQVADLVFWPCAMDFKYDDVRAMPDGHMDVCLFNGGIRNSENEEIARLLRKKTKVMVAYGSCAAEGGVPALGNLFSTDQLLSRAYLESESTGNKARVVPAPGFEAPEGEIELPSIHRTLVKLSDVVPVDYVMPGCPPTEIQTWEVIKIIAGAVAQAGGVIEAVQAGLLPAPGNTLVGVGLDKSVCDECERERRGVKIARFHRPHDFKPEDGWCLLEQGVLCLGSATRSGCEARCIDANMPCRGCYGPAGDSKDQGAAMLSAVGSMIDAESIEAATAILDDLADPAGTVYRFGMSASMLVRNMPEGK